jgi:hypothetical protein
LYGNVPEHKFVNRSVGLNMPKTGEQLPVTLTLETLLAGFSDDERKKTAETLLNTLEGQIENLNTRQAYKTAWSQFFSRQAQIVDLLKRQCPGFAEMRKLVLGFRTILRAASRPPCIAGWSRHERQVSIRWFVLCEL